MDKYRVRKGFRGTCVLQYLKNYVTTYEWLDVRYDKAPRALVSEFDVQDKIKKLEVEVAELNVENDQLRIKIDELKNKLGEQ